MGTAQSSISSVQAPAAAGRKTRLDQKSAEEEEYVYLEVEGDDRTLLRRDG